MKESKWNVFLDVRLFVHKDRANIDVFLNVRLKTHLLDYNVLIIRMFY